MPGLIVPASVALILGVALSAPWPDGRPLAQLLCGALAVTTVASLAARSRVLASTAVVAFLLPAGWWLGSVAHTRLSARPLRAALQDRLSVGRDGEPVQVEGRFREDALPGEDGAVMLLDVERVRDAAAWRDCSGMIRLSVRGEAVAEASRWWRRGRCARMPAFLRVPVTFRDPGVPDADLQLARRGIELVGTVKSASLVEPCGAGSPIAERASAARDAIRAAVARHVGRHDAQSGAIVSAILIGDRAAIDAGVEERLRKAGTFHVLAISGGNIAVLAGVLLWVLVGIRAPPRVAAWLTIAGLGLYAAIVVRGASVDRALLVALVYLAAGAADIRAQPIALLSTVAVVLVVAEPVTVFDLGFALTFGATAGIIVVLPRLARAAEWMRSRGWSAGRVPRVVRFVAWPALATLAAESAVLPISASAFGRVTFAGLVLNAIAIPLMAVAQVAGLVTAATSDLAPTVAWLAGWCAHLAVRGLVDSARAVDWCPWLVRIVPPPPGWILATYAAALLVACVDVLPARARLSAAGVVCACGIAMSAGWCPARDDPFSRRLPAAWTESPALVVTFLDVGQGDATLIQFPGGRTMLVDAGGAPMGATFDIARRVVSPAMRALGARAIDWLALTHGDPDHAGGAGALVEDWRPREIWEGVPVPRDALVEDVRRRAAYTGIPWRRARTFDELLVDDVTVRVWHPGAPDWERQRVRNDDSVVLELRTGDVSIVLPGDIGTATELRLADTWRPGRFCVLKAGHHGSAGSSGREWLAALRPAVVVYSAGQGNWFGHPAPQAIRRAQEVGAETFRTDQDGAVQVIVSGGRVTVVTYTGRWWSRLVR